MFDVERYFFFLQSSVADVKKQKKGNWSLFTNIIITEGLGRTLTNILKPMHLQVTFDKNLHKACLQAKKATGTVKE